MGKWLFGLQRRTYTFVVGRTMLKRGRKKCLSNEKSVARNSANKEKKNLGKKGDEKDGPKKWTKKI